jgi:glucose-6-phosphate isomerase
MAGRLDLESGRIAGAPVVRRTLKDLAGCFADRAACRRVLATEDPLVYTVSSARPAEGDGALHYGLGVLQPGRVGDEYYLTQGHLHAWRDAGEVYVGLRGAGFLLLEEEDSGGSRLLALEAGGVVYVPGRTAHRTVNAGPEPLVYLGVYPARAGHDYDPIARRNFRHCVVAGPTGPRLVERADLVYAHD